jgi:threonine aldolase
MVIEMRSDTFTLPTQAMREAMVVAPLGDDGYGEDPTVLRLERLAADVLGKEAACLFPSGTMANLAAVMTQAPRGTKILVGELSDIYLYEAGGASVCGGIVYAPIRTQPDGRLLLADLAEGFPADPAGKQFAPSALICLESTHNRCGGTILPLEYLAEVAAFAADRGVPVHLDGARIFNAAVGLGVPAQQIAAYADSVQFCLSKGLSAPIGSILAGTAGFIEQARRTRTMLGGAMRQAGVVAAPGIVALDGVDRLAEDHANARRFAEGLARIPGIEIQPSAVQTNIVMFRLVADRLTRSAFAATARELGLRVGGFGPGVIRAVTHAGVSATDINNALAIVKKVMRAHCAGTAAPVGAVSLSRKG